jgi:hypothetical protein
MSKKNNAIDSLSEETNSKPHGAIDTGVKPTRAQGEKSVRYESQESTLKNIDSENQRIKRIKKNARINFEDAADTDRIVGDYHEPAMFDEKIAGLDGDNSEQKFYQSSSEIPSSSDLGGALPEGEDRKLYQNALKNTSPSEVSSVLSDGVAPAGQAMGGTAAAGGGAFELSALPLAVGASPAMIAGSGVALAAAAGGGGGGGGSGATSNAGANTLMAGATQAAIDAVEKAKEALLQATEAKTQLDKAVEALGDSPTPQLLLAVTDAQAQVNAKAQAAHGAVEAAITAVQTANETLASTAADEDVPASVAIAALQRPTQRRMRQIQRRQRRRMRQKRAR